MKHRQEQRRAEHRGIILAFAANAAVLGGSKIFALSWSETAVTFLAFIQLAWIAPIAAGFAWLRPGSGYAKGIVIGAAISAIVSAGYCCQETKAPAPAQVPASRPVSRPVISTMLDAKTPATVVAGR